MKRNEIDLATIWTSTNRNKKQYKVKVDNITEWILQGVMMKNDAICKF